MKQMIIIILAFAFLASCKDKATNPIVLSEPLAPYSGINLKFDYYEIDENNNPFESSNPNNRNCYISINQINNLDDKPTWEYKYINSQNQEKGREYFSFDTTNQKIYMHSNFIDSLNSMVTQKFGEDSLPMKIENKWFTIADYKSDNWTIYEKDFANYPCFFQPDHRSFWMNIMKGKFTVQCSKLAEEKVSIGSKEITATPFLLEEKLDATYMSLDNSDNGPFTVDIKIKIYFAHNYGMIKRILYNIPMTLGNTAPTISGICIQPKNITFFTTE